MTVQTDQRPVRLCDSCGGVDDHPRHVFAGIPGSSPTSDEVAAKALGNVAGDQANTASIIAQIRDTTTVVKHLDCCASDGCPDGSCNAIHKESPAKTNGVDPANEDDVLRGEDLLAHLTSGAVDHIGNDLNAQRTTEAQVDAEVTAAGDNADASKEN